MAGAGAWGSATSVQRVYIHLAVTGHHRATEKHRQGFRSPQEAQHTMLPRVCGRTPRMTRKPSRACAACWGSLLSRPASSEGITESTALPAPPLNSTPKAKPAACSNGNPDFWGECFQHQPYGCKFQATKQDLQAPHQGTQSVRVNSTMFYFFFNTASAVPGGGSSAPGGRWGRGRPARPARSAAAWPGAPRAARG